VISISDVDECELGVSHCAQSCRNLRGSYMCTCEPGYQLGIDGKSCYRTSSPDVVFFCIFINNLMGILIIGKSAIKQTVSLRNSMRLSTILCVRVIALGLIRVQSDIMTMLMCWAHAVPRSGVRNRGHSASSPSRKSQKNSRISLLSVMAAQTNRCLCR